MMNFYPYLALVIVILCSCQTKTLSPEEEIQNLQFCTKPNSAKEKVYQKGGELFLWAGEDSSTHFNVTGWFLDPCRLTDYDYDRETFKALLDPDYVSIQAAPDAYDNKEKVIFTQSSDGIIKVFPYTLMKFHEVINEEVDGAPVMIAYCFLADLAAVYTRNYCGKEFTFAVSGYTYSDEYTWEGLDGFILWDRETESLWWPLLDVAISGTMKQTRLEKFDEQKWGLSTWGEMKTNHPDALLMISDPDWQAPENWPSYSCNELDCCE